MAAFSVMLLLLAGCSRAANSNGAAMGQPTLEATPNTEILPPEPNVSQDIEVGPDQLVDAAGQLGEGVPEIGHLYCGEELQQFGLEVPDPLLTYNGEQVPQFTNSRCVEFTDDTGARSYTTCSSDGCNVDKMVIPVDASVEVQDTLVKKEGECTLAATLFSLYVNWEPYGLPQGDLGHPGRTMLVDGLALACLSVEEQKLVNVPGELATHWDDSGSPSCSVLELVFQAGMNGFLVNKEVGLTQLIMEGNGCNE